MDEVTKLLKSLSARIERLELEGKQSYMNPPKIENRGNFRRPNNPPPPPPRFSKEIKEVGIGMIRESKPLSKITYLLMKKERKKRLILKSIVLETPPHLPI
jgi:hypothetical protein